MEQFCHITKLAILETFNSVFEKQCDVHGILVDSIEYDGRKVVICDIDKQNQYDFIIELVEFGIGKFGYSIEVYDGSQMIEFNELPINKDGSRVEQFIDAYNTLVKLSIISTKHNMNYFDKKLNQKMELSYNEVDDSIYNNLGSVVDKKDIYNYLIENDYYARADYGSECYAQLAFIIDSESYNRELYLKAIEKLAKN